MPFTVAHVMAVLPGVRWHRRLHLDPTCLVIGSMAPDFEYFARGELVSRVSHTLPGVLAWNLPATIVIAVLWHHVVKWPALAVLPRASVARVAPVFGRPWLPRVSAIAIVSIVVSALLGAATHLLWDGITQADGWFPTRIAALRVAYDMPGVGAMALHRIVQHASTLIGLTVVAIYVWRVLGRVTPIAISDAPSRTFVRSSFALCITAALVLIALRLRSKHIADPGSLIAGTITGLLVGTIAASLIARRSGRALEASASSAIEPLL